MKKNRMKRKECVSCKKRFFIDTMYYIRKNSQRDFYCINCAKDIMATPYVEEGKDNDTHSVSL